MLSTELSRPQRKRARLALVAALIAVGCSGGSGGGCGSSCGGAFVTQNPDGTPIKYTGDRLANVAQVRVTKSGFNFLNATHLNDILAALNNSASGGFHIPCIDAGTIFSVCSPLDITQVHLFAGDEQFTGTAAGCAAETGTPLHMTFKDVSWILDSANNVLKAHLVMHLKTGDMYLRTAEEHSSICGTTSAIQARVLYDDELTGLPQKDTAADLNIGFSTTPDGRLEFNFDNASLSSIVANFQPAALVIDGNTGTDPVPPATANYTGNGCDSGSGSYNVSDSPGSLNCAGVFDAINADCNVTNDNNGALCQIVQYIRGYLFNYIKDAFQAQIVSILRQQLDDIRCQRSTDSQGNTVACDSAHSCPADDDGTALACDTTRGVCYPASQGSANFNCEPISLAVQGELDVSNLTSVVGFPPGTKMEVFAGLGSKGANGAAHVDDNGLQLAAEAGTAPPTTNFVSVCVPPALPPDSIAVPAMDFDDSANKPTSVTAYDVGFSLASAMLNRGFYDAYNAGMLCIAVTNKTSSFISSGLFKTFLPSLGLVTGGTDVPMMILLRPTLPPYVRVGLNTTKKDANNNDVPDDPLITLNFNKMNLDFYALVDQRQVRIFTLQADLKLPLNLRTFTGAASDTLQPVLGGLDTLLTNISAISPDGGAYSATTDMLSEDPGVVKDLLAAAVQLAQPLLAGVIKPIQLPSMLGLKFGVDGVAGAVPYADPVNDGYNHLAIWAHINECGGTTGVICEQYNVKTQVKVANRIVPETLQDVRNGQRPALDLQLSALTARAGAYAQFSYRVDGGLWSAWLSNPNLRVQNPLFLVQGHHLVEVVAREAGDDRSADPQPVAVDFFVSYEPPKVSLTQRQDGAVVTWAHSAASRDSKLSYSYRVDGAQAWTQPGPARLFSQADLGGHGLSVSVSDEAGRAAQAHFGEEEGLQIARAGMSSGCASSSGGAPAFALLALLGMALLARRQRKGSSSVG